MFLIFLMKKHLNLQIIQMDILMHFKFWDIYYSKTEKKISGLPQICFRKTLSKQFVKKQK